MIEVDIRVEKAGIQRIQDKIMKLRTGLETYAPKALKEVGEQYYEIVISRMGESRGGEMVFADVYWKELSSMWLKEKREQGWVEEIWEATGEIKRNVRVFDAVKTANGWSVFVGLKDVSPDVLTKAIHNEFGATLEDRTIPARPLFGPAKREMAYNPAERQRMIEAFKGAVRLAINSIWK